FPDSSHSLVPFFFTDTATTESSTLSLHDALPIFIKDLLYLIALANTSGELAEQVRNLANLPSLPFTDHMLEDEYQRLSGPGRNVDRKSTRLNSSHVKISYAVFCLKKKNNRRDNSA